MKKYIKDFLELLFVWLLYQFAKALPIDFGSKIGSELGKFIGPKLPINKTAKKNFLIAFPETNKNQLQKNINLMWDNLGRTIFESAKLNKFDCSINSSRINIIGLDNINKIKNKNKSILFFSGHIGNWDLMPLTVTHNNLEIAVVYRKANNKFVNSLITKSRKSISAYQIPKGAEGAREIVKLIKKGKNIAMLVDQKQNDGISVPFFKKDSMTAPAIAHLAIKYDLPILPVSIAREKGASFTVEFFPPLKIENSGNIKENIKTIMIQINIFLENAIRKNPSQWLWVHKRW